MHTAKSVFALFLAVFLIATLAACDSGSDDNGLEATSYRLAGTPNSQVAVSTEVNEGSGGDISVETTSLDGSGLATESLNLEEGAIGVRLTVSAGQGVTSLELLDSGNDVLDSDSGSGTLIVENGDVAARP